MSKEFTEKDDFSDIIGSAIIPDLVGGFISPDLYQALTDDERKILQMWYNRYGTSAAMADLFFKKAMDIHSTIDYTQSWQRCSERSYDDKVDLTSFIEKLANKHGFSVAPENSEKGPSL